MPRRRTAVDSAPPRGITAPAATGGITSTDVDRAADSLLREGQRPTIEKVRLRIGRGSPNTINPLLDAWWSRLAGRLDAGPAALHRLPEPVLHAAEGLWLQCLNEARRRAQAESQSSRKTLARDRQDLEVHSHILSIREAELTERLRASDQRTARLELEIEALTTLLRKEQASRLAAERRLATAAAIAPHTARRSTRTTDRTAKSRKQVKKSPRAEATTQRTVTRTRRLKR